MPNPPTSTITFLFTDIEGSTCLWEEKPDTMRLALAQHDALLRTAIETNGGTVFKTIGDAFCAAFSTAPQALEAALFAQQSLQQVKAEGGDGLMLKVRMALHTGTAEQRDSDYFGKPLNRVARLLAAGHGGQILLSQTTYDLTRDLLPAQTTLNDLGEHRLKDLQRPEQVYQLQHRDLPADFPPLRSLDNPTLPNNLPQQVTSFIGRDTEIEAVKSLFAKTRLLTLTGSGGCGKTRLSLQVAADVLELYPDGVWLVELASLSDPYLVPQTVAEVLGVKEVPGEPITKTLLQALKAKQMLLVMDNCEHVLDASARLVDALLKSCPKVKILVSSREALGIAGESTYRVPSLSVPQPVKTYTPESLSQYEAVRLFIERAAAAKSDFTVTNQNAPALASVCHRLDGIPLAIELAAARVRSLTVEQITSRLDDRFRLLTGGSRTALPRQQTLRAMIDWSYDLLEENQKALLTRLSVFSGGWRLEAGEKVCSGGVVEEWEVLDLLMALVDKSLVIVEDQGEAVRYRLLETVRQYAREKLASEAEGHQYRRQHLDYFLALAEDPEKLTSTGQSVWLERLEREHDNLRTAMEWGYVQEEALRMEVALLMFWHVRGYYTEGRERLARGLARVDTQLRTPIRARALFGAGGLALSQGDFTAARTLYSESLDLYRELANSEGIVNALRKLGDVAYYQGDYITARTLLEESLGLCREFEYKMGIAFALGSLGELASCQGDYVTAHTLYSESLTFHQELGNTGGIVVSLFSLGRIVREQGDYTSARTLLEESLGISREFGYKVGIAHALMNMGPIVYEQGDYMTGRTLLEESLSLFSELRDRVGIANSIEALAALASAQQAERSALLWGAAESIREVVGSPMPPAERSRYDRHVDQIRAVLGEEAFASAWAQGRALTMEQAIEYALEKTGS